MYQVVLFKSLFRSISYCKECVYVYKCRVTLYLQETFYIYILIVLIEWLLYNCVLFLFCSCVYLSLLSIRFIILQKKKIIPLRCFNMFQIASFCKIISLLNLSDGHLTREGNLNLAKLSHNKEGIHFLHNSYQ